MLSLLHTRRWLAFTAAAALAILAFGLLSLWQWHRADDKRLEFAAIEQVLKQPAASFGEIPDPQPWQRLSATGRWDRDQQYLVRNRPQGGGNGFWVVGLLRSTVGDVWVVRGWTPNDLAAGAEQQAPEPPPGQVDVDGYVRTTEPGPLRAADLPAGQLSNVTVAELDDLAGTRTPTFYLQADRMTTAAGLTPLAIPEPTDSRNLSYAGQWLLFAVITIGGWFYFLRREAADDLAQSSVPQQPKVVA